jgi:hypothetical protein
MMTIESAIFTYPKPNLSKAVQRETMKQVRQIKHHPMVRLHRQALVEHLHFLNKYDAYKLSKVLCACHAKQINIWILACQFMATMSARRIIGAKALSHLHKKDVGGCLPLGSPDLPVRIKNPISK